MIAARYMQNVDNCTFPDHAGLDHPLVPVHLLVFGVEAFVTSLTCLVDVWSWPDRSIAEKQQLTMLYGPYVALGGFHVTKGSQRSWRLTSSRRHHGPRHDFPTTQTTRQVQTRLIG